MRIHIKDRLFFLLSNLWWRLRRKYKFGALRRTTPVEPSEPIEPAEPLSLAIKGRVAHGLTLKFESRDEWLGIRDWGLGVTGDW